MLEPANSFTVQMNKRHLIYFFLIFIILGPDPQGFFLPCHPVAGPRGPGVFLIITFGFHNLVSMVKPWNDMLEIIRPHHR